MLVAVLVELAALRLRKRPAVDGVDELVRAQEIPGEPLGSAPRCADLRDAARVEHDDGVEGAQRGVPRLLRFSKERQPYAAAAANVADFQRFRRHHVRLVRCELCVVRGS